MAPLHQQLPDLNALDAAALRALVMAQRTQLQGKDAEITRGDAEIAKRDIEIECLKLLLLKRKRMQFGRRSEKLNTEIEQLTLKLEELEADAAKPADAAAGEDISEWLKYIPARFEVVRVVRPKLSCPCCARVVKEPAPSRPIERGLAGPGLPAGPFHFSKSKVLARSAT